MKIINDKVTFDAADFDGLSDFAKKALPVYVGERTTVEENFSNVLEGIIESAKINLIRATQSDDSVAAVLRKLAAANAEKFEEALTAVNAVLASVVVASPKD